jgi:hypothetical protein
MFVSPLKEYNFCVSVLTLFQSTFFSVVVPRPQSPETNTNLLTKPRRIIRCILISVPVIIERFRHFAFSLFTEYTERIMSNLRSVRLHDSHIKNVLSMNWLERSRPTCIAGVHFPYSYATLLCISYLNEMEIYMCHFILKESDQCNIRKGTGV